MSDTLGRIVTRVVPGTSSGSNLFQAKRALASSTGTLVVSDLNHMGDEYAKRRTWAHPGFVGFYAGPPTDRTATAPRVSDIDWTGTLYDTKGRTANACCGSPWVVPVGASSTLPTAYLRMRVRCATKTSSIVGVIFAVTPGVGSFPSDASRFDSLRVTSSSLADQELKIILAQSDLAPLSATPSTGSTTSGVAPIGAPVRLMACTLWVGLWSNWNDSGAGETADVFGLTVGLE